MQAVRSVDAEEMLAEPECVGALLGVCAHAAELAAQTIPMAKRLAER